ncbi:MAG: energy-coupling factor ABC transporter ATP-binding protein [Dehalococcoidia bacterium]|nr:Energy-coupling factor transporter ATP-binding protein EcfA1 [Chloroflexota bacterium]MBT9161512.1 Energy-coupling factor transporter ATP-binding protein EcfA1 [Chloroflexota bacterium]
MFAIEVRDLCYKYSSQERSILDKVNLAVKKGEVVAIVGLSGSGKSTLCYCMNGLIPHVYKGELQGDVFIFENMVKNMKIADIATRVGTVFQDPDTQLFSPTVEDEVAFGPENLCLDREEIGHRITDALEQVGMTKHRLASPNHLSGGQKQLIAIASVLSLKPDVLIFDEIMSQIDQIGKKRIKEVVKNLKKSGKTIVMIEHNLNNLDAADRIMAIQEGKLANFTGELSGSGAVI